MKLKAKIAIPGKVVWEGEAKEIGIQTTTGKIGILPNHAPLVAAIETSVLSIKDEQTELMVISDGYLSLEKNSIFIATDRCILEDKIEPREKLDKDLALAKERFNNAQKPGKKYIAEKAINRIKACYKILDYRQQNS